MMPILVVQVVLVMTIMAMESIPAVALPIIQRELHTTTAAAALLVGFVNLMAAIATPIVGKLGDMFGVRRVLLVTIGCVVVGALMAATAVSLPMMLGGAVLQGIGFGFLPLTFALLRPLLRPDRMKKAVGIITGVLILGQGGGVVLAGPVAKLLSWHWMFALPGIVIALAGVGAWRFVPSTSAAANAPRPKMDWAGIALSTAAMVLLLFGLAAAPTHGWISTVSLAVVVAVVIMMAGWVLVERRASEPYISLEMLRRRGMWTANAVSLVIGVGAAIATIVVPQLVIMPKETGFGLGGSVTTTGLYLAPMILMSVVASPLAGFLDPRIGTRTTVAGGSFLVLIALCALAWLHSEPWQVILATVLLGLGYATASTGMYNMAVASVPHEETGIATGLVNVARALGAAIGGQTGAAILTSSIRPGTKLPIEGGFVTAFAVGACALAVGLVVSFIMPSRRQAGLASPAPAAAPVPAAAGAKTAA